MGRFTEWMAETYGAPANPAMAAPINPAANASAPENNPVAPANNATPMQPSMSDQAKDMQVMSMVKLRLSQLLDELEGYKIPKQKALPMLGMLIQQIQKQAKLSTSQVRSAMKKPKGMI